MPNNEECSIQIINNVEETQHTVTICNESVVTASTQTYRNNYQDTIVWATDQMRRRQKHSHHLVCTCRIFPVGITVDKLFQSFRRLGTHRFWKVPESFWICQIKLLITNHKPALTDIQPSCNTNSSHRCHNPSAPMGRWGIASGRCMISQPVCSNTSDTESLTTLFARIQSTLRRPQTVLTQQTEVRPPISVWWTFHQWLNQESPY